MSLLERYCYPATDKRDVPAKIINTMGPMSVSDQRLRWSWFMAHHCKLNYIRLMNFKTFYHQVIRMVKNFSKLTELISFIMVQLISLKKF